MNITLEKEKGLTFSLLEMSVYEAFREVLKIKLDHQADNILHYEWDVLPHKFPCVGPCMEDHQTFRSKRDLSPTDPAVLYLPLGGGGSKGCPSLAESSVVGISQMTFLWTVMSVFNVVANVVANINNNQNNRNNNNNNLQINKISTQNTQISANTNNANTITIMLPPPIPVLAGGRQLDAQQRLKRFVERERRIRKREAQEMLNKTEPYEIEFREISYDVLHNIVKNGMEDNNKDCLGRHLCHLGAKHEGQSPMETLALKIATFALLWVELEDRSQSFVQFLENVSTNDFDESLDCDLIFYKCQ